MLKIRTLLASLMLFTLTFLTAQDISGVWQGVSYITSGTNYYVLTLTLQQSGNNLTGSGLTKSVISPNYAIQTVAGTINANAFTFADQAIIEQLGGGWCMRVGTLTFDPNLEKLSGIVETRICGATSITMELYRLKIFADTVICTAKTVAIRATGKNLRWYADSTKTRLIHTGDSISPYINRDTTFYVTQSLYNTESPVVPITIRFDRHYNVSQTLKICTGQSVTVGDTIYRTNGTYIKKLFSKKGCDSIVTTNLTLLPT